MSEYHKTYMSEKEFEDEWGEPDGDNFPVGMSVSDPAENGNVDVFLDIAQSRKSRFARITIKNVDLTERTSVCWNVPDFVSGEEYVKTSIIKKLKDEKRQLEQKLKTAIEALEKIEFKWSDHNAAFVAETALKEIKDE